AVLLSPFERCSELQQVVRSAHQAPFAFNFPQATQQELAEAASLFHLPEDRLWQLLAQPIAGSPSASSEFRTHLRHPATGPTAGSARRRSVCMPLPTCRNVSSNMMASQYCKVALRAVSRIGRELRRLPPRIGFDLLHDRLELLHVGAVRKALRHDNL